MSVGYFAHQQEKFDQLVQKNNNKLRALSLISGSTNGAKWYHLTIVPCRHLNLEFIVKFEENKDPEKQDLKTTIRRKIQKGQKKKINLEVLLDYDDNYATVCTKWIFEFLFYRGYEFEYVDLILPPKYNPISNPNFNTKIGILDVRVSSSETDPHIVDWWLSKIYNPVNFLRIYANNLQMKISSNTMLHRCSKVQLYGNTDLNLQCIKDFEGQCIFYKEVHSNWTISDEDLKRLFIYLNEDCRQIKCVILKWTLPSEQKELEKFLKHRYYKRQVEENCILHNHHNCTFYFSMRETKTIVGNFDVLDYVDIDDASEYGQILKKNDQPGPSS